MQLCLCQALTKQIGKERKSFVLPNTHPPSSCVCDHCNYSDCNCGGKTEVSFLETVNSMCVWMCGCVCWTVWSYCDKYEALDSVSSLIILFHDKCTSLSTTPHCAITDLYFYLRCWMTKGQMFTTTNFSSRTCISSPLIIHPITP